ncbi:ABC transporter substrate-binding protein [Abyssisolibacter fermentans]|uniref:ABC transporter substrate-binding protein n=1 Tax=Abyssisolibacter fermentans TaxID=1766203 RepID=UPI00082D8616|nr:ABC transporter substrate-binding protein [Abyssisolibacter fermentans]
MKKIIILMLCFMLSVNVIGCQSDEPSEPNDQGAEKLEKVTFILDWLPNTNHTGIYTAIEKGYFTEEGLEIEIIQPTDVDVNTLVGAGQGDLGVSFQEQITMARTAKNPIPLVAVAAIIQHNTSGFAAPIDKNINSPKDFEGKKYGGWGTELETAFLKTLMKKDGADFDKIEIFDVTGQDFFMSVKNDVDFRWIFYGWDGIAAQVKNFPISFIKLQDVDPRLDFYTPVLVTNENMIKNKPDVIRKFLRAAKKGYEYAIENPDKAVEDLLKHAPETDKDIAIKSQEYLAKEYKKGNERWGEMKLDTWKNFGQWMYENNLLQNEFNAEEAFTNEFLPE